MVISEGTCTHDSIVDTLTKSYDSLHDMAAVTKFDAKK